MGPGAGLAGGGLAASLLGTLLATKERNAYISDLDRANRQVMDKQIQAQNVFQQQAGGNQQRTVEGAAGAQSPEALAAAAAQRNALALGNLSSGDPGGVPVSRSAPNVVATEIAKRFADALGFNQQQAGARSSLGARSDAGLNQSLALQEGRSNLGDIMSFSRGTAALQPGQQAAALGKVRPPSGIGDLFRGIGGAALGAGFSGLYPGGAGGADIPTTPAYRTGAGGRLAGPV